MAINRAAFGPTLPVSVGIAWDTETLVRVQSGATYGRMVRLQSGEILCSYEAGGRSWVTRSGDQGRTWGAPVLVRAISGAAAASPELLALRGGRLLLFYNQRPHDGRSPFAIGVCASDDEGRTWRAASPRSIYEAGRTPEVGCWEPAAVQLPSGDIHLFFANESPYPKNDDQEITRMRSRDNGATWSRPETVAYRAGHRDGMPVPLLLQNNPDITLAIEDNGLLPNAKLQPAIVSVPRGPSATPVGGSSPRRWGAIAPPLSPGIYAGAPYIRQMPTGETILSCQSDQGKRAKPRMVVYVGDRSARRFAERSVPFPVPTGVGGYWNALFVKNAETVTAISDTMIKNSRGLWAIDGHLKQLDPV